MWLLYIHTPPLPLSDDDDPDRLYFGEYWPWVTCTLVPDASRCVAYSCLSKTFRDLLELVTHFILLRFRTRAFSSSSQYGGVVNLCLYIIIVFFFSSFFLLLYCFLILPLAIPLRPRYHNKILAHPSSPPPQLPSKCTTSQTCVVMSGIATELPYQAIGPACGVFIYSTICLTASSSLLWATLAHREWKSCMCHPADPFKTCRSNVSDLMTDGMNLQMWLCWRSLRPSAHWPRWLSNFTHI